MGQNEHTLTLRSTNDFSAIKLFVARKYEYKCSETIPFKEISLQLLNACARDPVSHVLSSDP